MARGPIILEEAEYDQIMILLNMAVDGELEDWDGDFDNIDLINAQKVMEQADKF